MLVLNECFSKYLILTKGKLQVYHLWVWVEFRKWFLVSSLSSSEMDGKSNKNQSKPFKMKYFRILQAFFAIIKITKVLICTQNWEISYCTSLRFLTNIKLFTCTSTRTCFKCDCLSLLFCLYLWISKYLSD